MTGTFVLAELVGVEVADTEVGIVVDTEAGTVVDIGADNMEDTVVDHPVLSQL
jgi:hypothetical protein